MQFFNGCRSHLEVLVGVDLKAIAIECAEFEGT